MKSEVQGTIISIGATQQVTDTFRKRELILLEKDGSNEAYWNTHKIEFQKDNCDLLNGLIDGQEVRLKIDIRGKRIEKEGKTLQFTTLVCWKLEVLGDIESKPDTNNSDNADDEDLPF